MSVSIQYSAVPNASQYYIVQCLIPVSMTVNSIVKCLMPVSMTVYSAAQCLIPVCMTVYSEVPNACQYDGT